MSRRYRKGFNTSNKPKLAACNKLKTLVETGKMKIRSSSLISELKTFVAHGVGYAAKPGETYAINCFMDKEVWPLKVKFIGRETITTNLGTFKCLKYRPVMQQGRVFKHEEDLNIWITDDKNHIPILGQANVLVGSIKAELKSYKGLAHPISKI